MTIKTKYFGDKEVNEAGIITFNEGLPGFVDLRRFALMDDPDGGFYWLQSLEDEETAFILVDMNLYRNDYQPVVDEAYLEGMGEFDADKFAVLNIANLQSDIKDITVNLRAPIVVNTELKLGRQIVCSNEEYSLRDKLFSDAADSGDISE
jgi:flagellar assembly factor FliW